MKLQLIQLFLNKNIKQAEKQRGSFRLNSSGQSKSSTFSTKKHNTISATSGNIPNKTINLGIMQSQVLQDKKSN